MAIKLDGQEPPYLSVALNIGRSAVIRSEF